MSSTFVEAQHAAELALASMALRALLARAVADEPEVQRMAFHVLRESDGESVVTVEMQTEGGFAIGGYSL